MAGENFGEFGETHMIHQYFTQPNSSSNELAKGYLVKFTNVFLTETLKQLICQNFPHRVKVHKQGSCMSLESTASALDQERF